MRKAVGSHLRLRGGDPLRRLSGDVGDQLECAIEVEYHEFGQFGGSSDQEVRHGGGSVVSTVGEQSLNLFGSGLGPRGQVLHRHEGDGWLLSAFTQVRPHRAENPISRRVTG